LVNNLSFQAELRGGLSYVPFFVAAVQSEKCLESASRDWHNARLLLPVQRAG